MRHFDIRFAPGYIETVAMLREERTPRYVNSLTLPMVRLCVGVCGGAREITESWEFGGVGRSLRHLGSPFRGGRLGRSEEEREGGGLLNTERSCHMGKT